MLPLADIHVHLLAAMDDGPQSEEEALAMCKIAYDEGTRLVAATAHQNEHWSEVTPDGIRRGAQKLAQLLREHDLQLSVFPCAEIMAYPDTEEAWKLGKLLSVADRKQFVLIEMPDGIFVDLRSTVDNFRQMGVRVILAHPERHEEFLHDEGLIEEMIRMGCVVQVSAGSVTEPKSHRDASALKSWFKRGVVHAMGSDGHSPRRRAPRLAKAYDQVARWAGAGMADRVFSTNGMAILQGLPVRFSMPEEKKTWWQALMHKVKG